MNSEWRSNLNSIISQYKANLDNPNWLSDALLKLSTFLIHSSEEVSQAQFEEESAILKHIDSQINEGKKMSKAEAESRALVETRSHYKQLLLEREGVMETIQSMKKRLELLSWERKNS